MTKKQLLLLLLAVVLLGALLYLSRDWFAPESIQIGSTIRPNRVPERQQERLGPALKNRPYTVSFFFNRKYPLKSVRVVQVQELETNRFAHPLWHLVSDSNSVPVKSITYGVPVRGMRPTVKGAQADMLQAGVPYRLFIETPEQQASYDFTLGQK
jgi:hypothetical protein